MLSFVAHEFLFFKEICLLMTFKFVMFLFPAHIFFGKATHAF